jgi:proline iminopeptidase
MAPPKRWRRWTEPVHVTTEEHPVSRRIFILILAASLLGACRSTPPFVDAAGRVLPRSIASMETIRLGGIDQAVWFRARDVRAPALILLHGGPGTSESALFRHFNARLEDHFLVVYWEQRGTGRSYHRGVRRESMTIAQMEQDLHALVDTVRSRFAKQRVILLGHSWGTVLGTRYAHRFPERVAAYVAVAQIVDFDEGQRISLEWALTEALDRGDDRALAALRRLAPRPDSVAEDLELGRWVERLGGQMRAGLSTGRLILAALRESETSLIDLWKFGAGNRFSLEALRPQYAHLDLRSLREFGVPVVFMLGRHDWHVPSVLAADYFEMIDAPCKRLVWFEEAAHNPPFEQPERFLRAMVDVVLPMIEGRCAADRFDPSGAPAAQRAATSGPSPAARLRPRRRGRSAATPRPSGRSGRSRRPHPRS